MNLNEISPLLFFSMNGVFGTVFLLGIRHGFDADHLAAIDSLTRVNSDAYPTLSKWVGTLFSLGHGAIVCLAALCVSLWFGSWLVPTWMEQVGSWVSIAILLLLAATNFSMVFRSKSSAPICAAGWRSVVFGRLFSGGRASTVVAVGALFALSYDTLSFAALFGLFASRLHTSSTALLFGAIFVAGMLVTDGLNGVVVAKLIRRSEKNAYVTSLVVGLTVASVGLCTAALGIAKKVLPPDSVWVAHGDAWLGPIIFGLALVGLCSAVVVTRLKTA